MAQRPRSEKLCEAIVFVMDLGGGAALHEVSEADQLPYPVASVWVRWANTGHLWGTNLTQGDGRTRVMSD